MDFAQRLKRAREARGLTQFDLAVATGLKLPSIQKWEAGTYAPRMKHLLTLCEFFGWESPFSENPPTRVVLKGRVPAYAA